MEIPARKSAQNVEQFTVDCATGMPQEPISDQIRLVSTATIKETTTYSYDFHAISASTIPNHLKPNKQSFDRYSKLFDDVS